MFSDRWSDHGPFNGVILRSVQGVLETYVVLPQRNTPVESKGDLDCFFKRCNCYKKYLKDEESCNCCKCRNTVCLRDVAKPAYLGESGYFDYIDNARGFRALPYKV